MTTFYELDKINGFIQYADKGLGWLSRCGASGYAKCERFLFLAWIFHGKAIEICRIVRDRIDASEAFADGPVYDVKKRYPEQLNPS